MSVRRRPASTRAPRDLRPPAAEAIVRAGELGWVAIVRSGTVEVEIGEYPTRASALRAAELAIADRFVAVGR